MSSSNSQNGSSPLKYFIWSMGCAGVGLFFGSKLHRYFFEENRKMNNSTLILDDSDYPGGGDEMMEEKKDAQYEYQLPDGSIERLEKDDGRWKKTVLVEDKVVSVLYKNDDGEWVPSGMSTPSNQNEESGEDPFVNEWDESDDDTDMP